MEGAQNGIPVYRHRPFTNSLQLREGIQPPDTLWFRFRAVKRYTASGFSGEAVSRTRVLASSNLMQMSQVSFDAETQRREGGAEKPFESLLSAASARSAAEVCQRNRSATPPGLGAEGAEVTEKIVLLSAPNSAAPRLRVKSLPSGLRQSRTSLTCDLSLLQTLPRTGSGAVAARPTLRYPEDSITL
jgi:hypothetical protein